MLSLIRRLTENRSGSATIGYGLLTALVGVAVIGGASGLGDAFTGLSTDVSSTLADVSGGAATSAPTGDGEATAPASDDAAEPSNAADDGWFDLGLGELLGGGDAASSSGDGDDDGAGLEVECDSAQGGSAGGICP
jgi:pilus assembly protein Flp/PilA